MNKRLLSIYNFLHKAYGPQHWWPGDTPFEVMIGAILTQSTSWTNVEKSIVALKQKNLLSPQKMNALPNSKLAKLIKSSGYFNQKAKKVKHFLKYFIGEYKASASHMKRGNMITLRSKLLNVHGIGPETADSILLYALDKPIFVIDAYTKRIFSRLGVLKGNENYHETQKIFMDTLKHDVQMFNEYHALIVNHGKFICKKSKPKCDECVVRTYCAYAKGHGSPLSRG